MKDLHSPNMQSCINVSLKALFGPFPAQLKIHATLIAMVADSIRRIIFSALVPPTNAKRVILTD